MSKKKCNSEGESARDQYRWWAVDVRHNGKTFRVLCMGDQPEITILKTSNCLGKPMASMIIN